MPRETITTPTPADDFEVKVGWARDMDMQIGVEQAQGKSLFWQLLGSEVLLPEIGMATRWAVSGSSLSLEEYSANEANTEGDNVNIARRLLNAMDTSAPWYQGVWANLDRKGCNDLIRILRRARDAAFGRDE